MRLLVTQQVALLADAGALDEGTGDALDAWIDTMCREWCTLETHYWRERVLMDASILAQLRGQVTVAKDRHAMVVTETERVRQRARRWREVLAGEVEAATAPYDFGPSGWKKDLDELIERGGSPQADDRQTRRRAAGSDSDSEDSGPPDDSEGRAA